MKRPSAEMEGDDEDDAEEEPADGDVDDDIEEDAAHEPPARERHHPDAEEDVEEDDEDGDDHGERHEQDHGLPSNVSTPSKSIKGPPKKKLAMDHDDHNDEDDEENLDIELGKSQTVDPERMQAILAQFTPEQMSRYECYRRSGFQKSNMRRLLQSVAGCPISMPMTIVMSGIAKMFVGELVETGRTVMKERNETGPTRPCHIREAFRRLKLKGKVPRRTRPRLFH